MPRYEIHENVEIIENLLKTIQKLEEERESLKNTVEYLRNITSTNNLKTFGN